MLPTSKHLNACKYVENVLTGCLDSPTLSQPILSSVYFVGGDLPFNLDPKLQEKFREAAHQGSRDDTRFHNRRFEHSNEVDVELCQHVSTEIVRLCQESRARGLEDELTYLRNLRYLSEVLGLSDIQYAICEILVETTMSRLLQKLWELLLTHNESFEATLALFLNTPSDDIRAAMCGKSGLPALGVVVDTCSHRYEHNTDTFDISPAVRADLSKSVSSPSEMKDILIGKSQTSTLKWTAFEHFGEQRAIIHKYLKASVRDQVRGVNILLHGPPGTGKTEFAKTLAEKLQLDLFAVGEMSEDDTEPSRGERLSSYLMAQTLIARGGKGVILFDEIEDLLDNNYDTFGRNKSVYSKIFFNRMLENNPVPTIWIGNNPQMLGSAILRRMALTVEIPLPCSKTSKRFWRKECKAKGISLKRAELDILSGSYRVPPSIISSSTTLVSTIGGGFKELKTVLDEAAKISEFQKQATKVQGAKNKVDPFSYKLVKSDLNLEVFTGKIVNCGARDLSICIDGPPGSGKSAYVRHLAGKLEMKVLQKRTSDLISMWVGESEKAIAAAFEQAKDEKKFLIFDEADSLLLNRAEARNRWEVSQVNEMLTWMESHEFPFACTTNMGDRLDPATLRRFLFKLTFGFMGPCQIEDAFEHFFGINGVKSAGSFKLLCPADFALVKKKAKTLNLPLDQSTLVQMLKEEEESKKTHFRAPLEIGFKPNASEQVDPIHENRPLQSLRLGEVQ